MGGLSVRITVVEALKNSDPLITASCPLEQGCEIFAVPGSRLHPRSAGTNQLLRDSVNWAENAEDVHSALRETRVEEPGVIGFARLR